MDVTEYLRRSRAGENLLYSACDECTSIQVYEFANERWAFTGDNPFLSLMRLDAPDRPAGDREIRRNAARRSTRLQLRLEHIPDQITVLPDTPEMHDGRVP